MSIPFLLAKHRNVFCAVSPTQAELEELGAGLLTDDAKWEENFARLVKFKRKHGHCDVIKVLGPLKGPGHARPGKNQQQQQQGREGRQREGEEQSGVERQSSKEEQEQDGDRHEQQSQQPPGEKQVQEQIKELKSEPNREPQAERKQRNGSSLQDLLKRQQKPSNKRLDYDSLSLLQWAKVQRQVGSSPFKDKRTMDRLCKLLEIGFVFSSEEASG